MAAKNSGRAKKNHRPRGFREMSVSLSARQAAQLLDDICGINCLVIGDVMLDRFVDGKVERISPEAPVPILSHSATATMPGGAANVARNICHLGASCTLIGITGTDEAGTTLSNALAHNAGLSFCPVQIAGRPTTSKTRFRSGMQQIMRLDDEVKTPLNDTEAAQLLAIAETHIPKASIIILSDYAKGCLTRPLIKSLISLAKSHDKTVIIDPKSDDFSLYEGADLITPNLSELVGATGLQDTSDEMIAKTANALSERHQIAHVLTTLSARGMRLDGSGITAHVPSLTKDVFDVSGAGDTVVAALACAYASGASFETAMIFANQAASIVVSKPGTAAFCAGEFLASCDKIHAVASRLDDHQDKLAQWRKEGLKIGFTNGCFDLLHAGHMHVLREAAKICDKLIVGVNSNQSVSALKGPSRPIQPQKIRAFVLAQLPYCDGVIIFDDETPLALIEAISPDVLIKGGDYQPSEIVGHAHVTKKGGDVLTIPLLEGHSTTAFLAQ